MNTMMKKNLKLSSAVGVQFIYAHAPNLVLGFSLRKYVLNLSNSTVLNGAFKTYNSDEMRDKACVVLFFQFLFVCLLVSHCFRVMRWATSSERDNRFGRPKDLMFT